MFWQYQDMEIIHILILGFKEKGVKLPFVFRIQEYPPQVFPFFVLNTLRFPNKTAKFISKPEYTI